MGIPKQVIFSKADLKMFLTSDMAWSPLYSAGTCLGGEGWDNLPAQRTPANLRHNIGGVGPALKNEIILIGNIIIKVLCSVQLST